MVGRRQSVRHRNFAVTDKAGPASGQLSFWNWMHDKTGPRRTRGQIAFALILTAGVFVLWIPLWYWILMKASPSLGDYSGAPVASGVLFAILGAPFAGTTVYVCRPTGRRANLLTGLWALAAAFVAPLGVLLGVGLTLDWKLEPLADKFFNIPLTLVCLLPASLLVLAGAYLLGWRRYRAATDRHPRAPAS